MEIVPGFSPFCLKTVTDESLQLGVGNLYRGQTVSRPIYRQLKRWISMRLLPTAPKNTESG